MNPFDGSSSIHHVPEVIELLEDAGILVMSIEETFSSVKYFIKDDPQSISNITKEQCIRWISDSGYA